MKTGRCSQQITYSAGVLVRHFTQCSRNGVVQRDGKWFCKQHDPVESRVKRIIKSYEREIVSLKRAMDVEAKRIGYALIEEDYAAIDLAKAEFARLREERDGLMDSLAQTQSSLEDS